MQGLFAVYSENAIFERLKIKQFPHRLTVMSKRNKIFKRLSMCLKRYDKPKIIKIFQRGERKR